MSCKKFRLKSLCIAEAFFYKKIIKNKTEKNIYLRLKVSNEKIIFLKWLHKCSVKKPERSSGLYILSLKNENLFSICEAPNPPSLFLFLLFCLIRRDLTHFSITFSPNYLIKLRLLTQSISISSRRNVFLHFLLFPIYIYIC